MTGDGRWVVWGGESVRAFGIRSSHQAIAPPPQPNSLASSLLESILPAGLAGRGTPGITMLINVLKSKIHRARVTAGDVDYEGSLGIDQDLMDKIGLLPYERILCGNMANGERFETYAIPAQRGSGQIILNGATARLGKPGDRLTIMSFTELDPAEAKSWKPHVIVLGDKNAVISERGL